MSPSYSSKFADERPGPYISVRISSPVTNEFRDVQGILDTGADQTIIPLVTAKELKLKQIGEADVFDANGGKRTDPLYAVNVAFEGLNFQIIEVASGPYAIALIGRDILDDLVVTFDGPNQTFTWSKP